VTVDLVTNKRRPQLRREVSDSGTALEHRGSGDGMCAKDRRVNTGDPPSCAGECPRNWRTVRIRAGRGWKSEGPTVALKRVTIVERRGLGSRVRSEGTRARAIGVSLATSTKRSAVSEGLRCPSEPWACPVGALGGRKHQPPCPKAGCREIRMSGLMSGIWKRSLRATAPDLDSTRSLKLSPDAIRGDRAKPEATLAP
jgi:hypothetical protein